VIAIGKQMDIIQIFSTTVQLLTDTSNHPFSGVRPRYRPAKRGKFSLRLSVVGLDQFPMIASLDPRTAMIRVQKAHQCLSLTPFGCKQMGPGAPLLDDGSETRERRDKCQWLTRSVTCVTGPPQCCPRHVQTSSYALDGLPRRGGYCIPSRDPLAKLDHLSIRKQALHTDADNDEVMRSTRNGIQSV